MTGLSVTDLSKSFGEVHAVAGISFEVSKGEVLALLGPSGSGKSTVLGIIAGLERPDRGDIYWEGRLIVDVPPHQRGFGLMFQDLALFPHMNVFDNVAFGLRMRSLSAEKIHERVKSVLELVGLQAFERRDVNTLSGGEQQRIALARSLAPSPHLLMLDEPLGSLDRSLRERLVSELAGILRTTQQTAIYVTHDQQEAFALADRVAVMKSGRLEQVDTPQNIYTHPASPFVARFLGMSNLLDGETSFMDGLRMVRTKVGDFPVESYLEGAVTCLLRPDGARLDGTGSWRLAGKLVSCSYRGGFCRARVEVNNEKLEFDFKTSARLPKSGELINLSFDLHSALQLFPREDALE